MFALWGTEFFTMSLWSLSIGAIGAAVAGILIANTDYLLSKTETATLEYLEQIELKTIGDVQRPFKAKEMWEKNGAVIMAIRRPGCFLCRAEASALSALKPELDQLGVPLYGVVKEKLGTEVEDFQPFFKGEIFLDEKQLFYGPQTRKMVLMGLLRLGVWQNFRRAWKGGFEGNLKGEGLILGGMFVVGAGNQGILLEHREVEFGDKANMTAVLEAAKKINNQAETN